MSLPVIPETHLEGVISIENIPDRKAFKGDLGIQIARDGRLWICIDGIAFLRVRPVGAYEEPLHEKRT